MRVCAVLTEVELVLSYQLLKESHMTPSQIREFYTRAEVLALLQPFKIGRTALVNGSKAGRYPQAIEVTPRKVIYRASEVGQLIERLSKGG